MGKQAKKKTATVVPLVDMWSTEDNAYSLDAFYTRSKDFQGHSTVYHVRMPDYVAGEIAAIIESKKIPEYRTAADLIRDAIIHRLHYLGERVESLSEGMAKTISRVTIENQTTQYQNELKAYSELCVQVRDACREALAASDYDQLYSYIQQQRDLAEAIREPFRSRVLEVLDEYERRLA